VARDRAIRILVWLAGPGAHIRQRYVHDEPAHCSARSTSVAMATATAGTPLFLLMGRKSLLGGTMIVARMAENIFKI